MQTTHEGSRIDPDTLLQRADQTTLRALSTRRGSSQPLWSRHEHVAEVVADQDALRIACMRLTVRPLRPTGPQVFRDGQRLPGDEQRHHSYRKLASMLSDRTAQRTVLDLTEAQRAQIMEESGVAMQHINATGRTFIFMILAAKSMELRDSQQQMQEELGTSGESILEFPVVELTERLRVVPVGPPFMESHICLQG